jgi:hypothetical protein
MNRAEILDKAKEAVSDREGKYGHPRENFGRIARRWNAHIDNRYGGKPYSLDADDVAAMLVDVKLARAESGVYHPDNFIDVAGYAALAAEIGASAVRDTETVVEVRVNYEEKLKKFLRERGPLPDDHRDTFACTCDAKDFNDIPFMGCPLGDYLTAGGLAK